jgi:hypothetical protein
VLKFWHLASLDAPTVAVVWAWAFGWSARLPAPDWSLAILALVVWAVYIGDRLLDACAGRRNPSVHLLHDRHFFHWRHRWILAPIAGAASLVALWMVRCRVPAGAMPQDSVVAAATLAYFSGVHGRFGIPSRIRRLVGLVSREFLVGGLFAAGCLLPAMTAAPVSSGLVRAVALPGLFFAALAWLNVHAIGRWEGSEPHSRSGVLNRAAGIAVAALLCAAVFAGLEPRCAALLGSVAFSALLLAVLDRSRDRFTPLALRAAADLVLLTPLLLVPAAYLAR